MPLLVLRITEDCNLDCRYCYAKVINPTHMKYEVAIKAIEAFNNKFTDFKIQLTGGEPLLNYNLIKEITMYLRKKHLHPHIFLQTNGTLLDEKNLEFFKENCVDISLSVDALGRTHDSLRPFKSGTPSFKTIDSAINMMGKMGLKTQLNAVLTKYNVGELDKLLDYALLKGNINGISIDVLRNTGKGEDSDSASALETEKLLERITEKLILFKKANINIELKDFSKMIYFLRSSIEKSEYCYAQTNESVVVRPNGDYYPCSSFANDERYLIGNIDEGIFDIKVFDDIKILRDECSCCEIVKICCGACPAGKIYNQSRLDCVIKKHSYDYAKNYLKES